MLKILWIVNTIFPDAAKKLNLEQPIYGGWMYGLAADMAKTNELTLAVACIYSGSVTKSFSVNGIQYYLLPNTRKKNLINPDDSRWSNMIMDCAPDIVHIHGTEFSHGMELMNTHPNLKYIISLQGMVSVIHRYYLAGMELLDVLRNITFRDIVRWNTLFHAKHDFYKRGQVEKEYINRASAVIGRTDWDYAHALAINPKINYFNCNESLRDEFYTEEKWSIENCRRHSIFLSQAGYPIKGLHQVLKAASILKDKYPDIFIEIAGHDITNSKTIKNRLKRSGYGKYISRIIKKTNLQNSVKFLGPLSAEAMKNAYLRAHAFICPSSIENSPNSLGEAQILGVPCIATYCGGIPSMVNNGENAILYRFEEYEMLAENINQLFISTDSANKLSIQGRNAAILRHNRRNNLNTLISIYNKII